MILHGIGVQLKSIYEYIYQFDISMQLWFVLFFSFFTIVDHLKWFFMLHHWSKNEKKGKKTNLAQLQLHSFTIFAIARVPSIRTYYYAQMLSVDVFKKKKNVLQLNYFKRNKGWMHTHTHSHIHIFPYLKYNALYRRATFQQNPDEAHRIMSIGNGMERKEKNEKERERRRRRKNSSSLFRFD